MRSKITVMLSSIDLCMESEQAIDIVLFKDEKIIFFQVNILSGYRCFSTLIVFKFLYAFKSLIQIQFRHFFIIFIVMSFKPFSHFNFNVQNICRKFHNSLWNIYFVYLFTRDFYIFCKTAFC